MKKGIKILMGIVISILVLTILYIFLIIKGILPNPLLDTKDLYCYRDSSNISIDDKVEDERIFKFDSKAIIQSYEEITIYTFVSEEYAKDQYKYFKEEESLYDVSLDKNVLTTKITYNTKKDEGYYGKTKTEIIKIYGDEFGYECK